MREANPSDVQLTVVVAHGDTQLAYSNVYDLQGHTGEPAYVLFGGWQTEQTLGYVAAVQGHGHIETYISTEDRGDRDIETELRDRIGQVIAWERGIDPERDNDRDNDLGFGFGIE